MCSCIVKCIESVIFGVESVFLCLYHGICWFIVFVSVGFFNYSGFILCLYYGFAKMKRERERR